jgi:phosphate/sulfate permease
MCLHPVQCEANHKFIGTMLLDASVASTTHKKMIDGDVCTHDLDVLMTGMLTTLVSASLMVLVANVYALLISTTHIMIDSITGFSIAAKDFKVRDLVRTDQMHVCATH